MTAKLLRSTVTGRLAVVSVIAASAATTIAADSSPLLTHAQSTCVSPADTGQETDRTVSSLRHIRFKNERIAEVMAVARRQSPAFSSIVNAIEASNAVVYVEEGRCRRDVANPCLRLVSATAGRYLLVRLDPREPLIRVVGHLAHELQHAVEIAMRPDVVDQASVERLYQQIGYRSGAADTDSPWETRQAQAIERQVTSEVREFRGVVTPAYFGVWALSWQLSTQDEPDHMIDAVRIHRDQGHGLISVVVDAVLATGADARRAFVYKIDGKEYFSSGPDAQAQETIALQTIDALTVAFVERRNGKIVVTGRHAVAADGTTLTVESCTIDADGHTQTSTTVWKKQDDKKPS